MPYVYQLTRSYSELKSGITASNCGPRSARLPQDAGTAGSMLFDHGDPQTIAHREQSKYESAVGWAFGAVESWRYPKFELGAFCRFSRFSLTMAFKRFIEKRSIIILHILVIRSRIRNAARISGARSMRFS